MFPGDVLWMAHLKGQPVSSQSRTHAGPWVGNELSTLVPIQTTNGSPSRRTFTIIMRSCTPLQKSGRTAPRQASWEPALGLHQALGTASLSLPPSAQSLLGLVVLERTRSRLLKQRTGAGPLRTPLGSDARTWSPTSFSGEYKHLVRSGVPENPVVGEPPCSPGR